jgi:hypothetical protein
VLLPVKERPVCSGLLIFTEVGVRERSTPKEK